MGAGGNKTLKAAALAKIEENQELCGKAGDDDPEDVLNGDWAEMS